jgi:hypothetical protein
MSHRLAANWNGFTSVSDPGKVAVVAALTLFGNVHANTLDDSRS